MTVNPLEIVALFSAVYPLLWVQTFSPSYRMRLYLSPNLDGPNEFVVDGRPPFFSAVATFWSCCFVILAMRSKLGCSLAAADLNSEGSALGVLSIALAGKCLFGAVGDVHKRVLLTPNRTLVRPLNWRALDLITPIPGNIGTKLVSKLLWFPLFWAAAWLMNLFQTNSGDSKLIVPEYVFLACAMIYIGRLATLYTKRNDRPFASTLEVPSKAHWNGASLALILLVCTASFFITYIILESALIDCGATPNVLPSMTHVLLGLVFIPVGTVAVGVLGAIVAHLLVAND